MSILEELMNRRRAITEQRLEIDRQIFTHRQTHGKGTTPIKLREESERLNIDAAAIGFMLESLGYDEGERRELEKSGLETYDVPLDDEVDSLINGVGYILKRQLDATARTSSLKEGLRKKDSLLASISTFLNAHRIRYEGHSSSCSCSYCGLRNAMIAHETHSNNRKIAAGYATTNRKTREERLAKTSS